MSNNAALFKVSGTALEDLSETAQHYGETTVFSASEAADALGYMALAGWDAQKRLRSWAVSLTWQRLPAWDWPRRRTW